MAYDEAGVCKPVAGSRHTNAVTALSTSGNATYSAAMDDTVREIENGQFA